MNAKRILATGLVCAMALSTAAFAVDTDVTAPDSTTGLYSSSTEITGKIETPIIKVTVPSTGEVVVNPYKMSVTVDQAKVTDQIISAPQFIKNSSNVAISVDASITGTIGTDSKAVFGTAAPDAKTTTNTVFMYLEVMNAENGTDAPTWATTFDKAKHAVAAKGKAAVIKNVVTLEAATYTDDAVDTGSETFAAFHLAGAVAPTPAKPWGDKDTVGATVAFTFTPIITEAAKP